MNSPPQGFDWSLFWLLQVTFLGVPTLITVIAFRGGPTLSHHRAAVLVFILIGLTVLNVIVGTIRAAHRHRSRVH